MDRRGHTLQCHTKLKEGALGQNCAKRLMKNCTNAQWLLKIKRISFFWGRSLHFGFRIGWKDRKRFILDQRSAVTLQSMLKCLSDMKSANQFRFQ